MNLVHWQSFLYKACKPAYDGNQSIELIAKCDTVQCTEQLFIGWHSSDHLYKIKSFHYITLHENIYSVLSCENRLTVH